MFTNERSLPRFPEMLRDVARRGDSHLKRGEHSASGLRHDHLGAQLVKFFPERFGLESHADADQGGMKGPFGGQLPVVARMVIAVMAIVVVAVVARLDRVRRRGDRIRGRMDRQGGDLARIRAARSLRSSGALQAS